MIVQGNALTELKKMDSDSMDCVVTSPPYWSLRKYDIPDVIWEDHSFVTPGLLRGEVCEHEWGRQIIRRDRGQAAGESAQVGNQKREICGTETQQGQFCLRCGAWKGQLGLEPTFELYLKHLLSIFDEVKRVLKKEGTCWVNMGDSYSGSNGPGYSETKWKPLYPGNEPLNPDKQWTVPAKSLCLIPYRFAIAMVDRGWICRNTIIWYKRNCMPSSAKDRFTVDFEPLFFFVKSRKYWFDADSVKLPCSPATHARVSQDLMNQIGSYRAHGGGKTNGPMKAVIAGSTRKLAEAGSGIKGNKSFESACVMPVTKRNRRCVWEIPTAPYSEAHFATFPEDLVEPMIRAGCPKDGIVLDPFCGSGTTLRVAESLQRQAIGIDLGYQDLVDKRKRNNQVELYV